MYKAFSIPTDGYEGPGRSPPGIDEKIDPLNPSSADSILLDEKRRSPRTSIGLAEASLSKRYRKQRALAPDPQPAQTNEAPHQLSPIKANWESYQREII